MAVTVADIRARFSADTSAAESGVKNLGSKIDDLSHKIDSFSDSAKRSGQESASAFKGLGGAFSEAGERGASAFSHIGDVIGGNLIAGGIQKVASGLIDLTQKAVALGASFVEASNEFNAGMANVASLSVPLEHINAYKSAVQSMAIETAKDTKDLTGGLYQVVSAFGDTADTAKILEINAKAASAGVASTVDSINLTSAVTKGYGDTSAAAVQHVTDLALKTVELGQTTFPELASSVGKVVPLSQQLGVSQQELFAVLATGSGVTGTTSEVATQYRGILQSLMAPTDTMAKLTKAMGFQSGEAMLKQLGLSKTVGVMVAAAKRANIPLQDFIGSIEGQTLAMALAGPLAKKYQDNLKGMAGAAGKTDEAFKAQTQGVNALGFKLAQAGAWWQVFKEKAGDAIGSVVMAFEPMVEPMITKLAANLEAFLPKVTAWAARVQAETKKAFDASGGGAAGAVAAATTAIGAKVTYDVKTEIQTIKWGDWIGKLDWNNYVGQIVWHDFLGTFSWEQKVAALKWGDFVAVLDWNRFITVFNWGGYVTRLDWANKIGTFTWGEYVGKLDWGKWIFQLEWKNHIAYFELGRFVSALRWDDFIGKIDWTNKVAMLHWGDFIGQWDWSKGIARLNWGDYVVKFNWSDNVRTIQWGDYVTRIIWGDHLRSLQWGDFIAHLSWGDGVITVLRWGDFVAKINWSTWVGQLQWGSFVDKFDWSQKVWMLKWGDYVVKFDWSGTVPKLIWNNFILSLSWSSFVSSLQWGAYVAVVSWGTFIASLEWGAYIGVISWSNFVSSLAWSDFVSSITWSGFIPSVNWSSLIPSFSWSNFIKSIDLSSWVPRFPGWTAIFGGGGSSGGNGSSGGGGGSFGGNASGTNNWRGGWTWVGERGPELLNLPAGSKILSNANSKALVGHMADGNVSVPSGLSSSQAAGFNKFVNAINVAGDKSAKAQERAANKAAKAFDNVADKIKSSLEGLLEKVPGLFSPSQVTSQDMELSKQGLYKDKVDEVLRRVRSAAENEKDAGKFSEDIAKAKEALNRIGITASDNIKTLATQFEQAWSNQSLFSAKENLGSLNMDAVKRSVMEQQQQAQGKANILQLFGIQPDQVQAQSMAAAVQIASGLSAGIASAKQAGFSDAIIKQTAAGLTPEAMAPVSMALTSGITAGLGGKGKDKKVIGADFGVQIAGAINDSLTNSKSLDDTGASILQKITGGWRNSAQDVDMVSGLASAMNAQLASNTAISDLMDVGGRIAKILKQGIDKYFKDATLADSVGSAVKSTTATDATKVGANANGTNYWRGGLTWVGEHGKELVNLARGAQVIPHTQSMVMAGAGGGPVYITVNASVDSKIDVHQLARQVGREFQRTRN